MLFFRNVMAADNGNGLNSEGDQQLNNVDKFLEELAKRGICTEDELYSIAGKLGVDRKVTLKVCCTTFNVLTMNFPELSGQTDDPIFSDCYQQPRTTSSLVGRPLPEACSLPTSNSQIIEESRSSE